MRPTFNFMIFLKYSIILFLWFSVLFSTQVNAKDSLFETSVSFFSPLPQSMPGSDKDSPEQITLGNKLYFETSLSVNRTQSCNSCHNISNNAAGVDNLQTSIGALGKVGLRNAPTTWNAGMHVAQFWDGRAKDLEEQASFPIFNPDEMAMPSEIEVVSRLKKINYFPDFKKAYPNEAHPINLQNISNALASFQRTLITRDRFDEYLSGRIDAIDSDEKRGLEVFISKGCVACHNGSLLGGQLFMKMGLVHSYPNKKDRGVAQVTGNPADNYFFKVPSLRNILNTAPYFHDGAAASTDKAILDTGWHQLGIRLNKKDVADIKVFFQTLNNKLQNLSRK